MKDRGSRFVESPEAARRPLPFRAAYQAHPFLLAGVPIALGAAAWGAGIYLQVGLLTVVGAGLVAFGIFLELLNVVDQIWRRAQGSRT